MKDKQIIEEIRKTILRFATKKYDTRGKTILLSFDSKQLNNVSEAILPLIKKLALESVEVNVPEIGQILNITITPEEWDGLINSNPLKLKEK